MNLLYIVFGTKERYHYEAIFSILSFLAKNKGIYFCLYGCAEFLQMFRYKDHDKRN